MSKVIKVTRVEDSQIIGEPRIETELWLKAEFVQRWERNRQDGGSFVVYMGQGLRIKESPEELSELVDPTKISEDQKLLLEKFGLTVDD